MREKVARAIHASIYGSEIMWKESLPAADAALDALAEPTSGMVDAEGGEYVSLYRADDPTYEPRLIFRGMIQAAKEGL